MTIDDFKTQEEYVSQMEHGALLNPRIDSTFKALFTQPTPESRAALHSFLEAATERKIKKYELKANDSPVGFDGQRGVTYDILCQFEDGLTADIEMQASDQEYDYGKRAEYQVARLETTYLQKGDDWEKAPIVYQISVLNFNYKCKSSKNNGNSKGSKNPVSRYAMRTNDGRELSNTLNIIFIELPKAKGLEKTLETNTPLENWAIFLKLADNPKKQDLIQKLTNKEAGLMNAQKSLSNISANKDYWIAQYRQEIRERDYRSGLSAAERRGLQQGIQRGLQQGIQQGLLQGTKNAALANARNLLSMHLGTIEQISQACGLSVEEVRALAEKLGE